MMMKLQIDLELSVFVLLHYIIMQLTKKGRELVPPPKFFCRTTPLQFTARFRTNLFWLTASVQLEDDPAPSSPDDIPGRVSSMPYYFDTL